VRPQTSAALFQQSLCVCFFCIFSH